MEDVKQIYENACNEYANQFCEKHGFLFEDGSWVAEDVGEVFEVCDYYVNMSVIRESIDNDRKTFDFFDWYDYDLRIRSLGVERGYLNFKSWCMGAPRLSDNEFERIEKMQKDIENLKEKLQEAIKNEF